MNKKAIGISILALCVCITGVSAWTLTRNNTKELDVVAPDASSAVNTDWLSLTEGNTTLPQPNDADAAVSGVAPAENIEVVEEADGSVTIHRTWGERQTEENDGDPANMGSGGGEIPLGDDGAYHGDHQDTPTAPAPEPTPVPGPAPAPEPTPAPQPESTAPETQQPETPSSGNGGNANPKPGDTKVDGNGDTWVYMDDHFGWIKKDVGYAGPIIPDTDAVPGTGETIGTM